MELTIFFANFSGRNGFVCQRREGSVGAIGGPAGPAVMATRRLGFGQPRYNFPGTCSDDVERRLPILARGKPVSTDVGCWAFGTGAIGKRARGASPGASVSMVIWCPSSPCVLQQRVQSSEGRCTRCVSLEDELDILRGAELSRARLRVRARVPVNYRAK